MPLVEVNNLTILIEDSQKMLVKDISFNLKNGCVTGLVGESGSGKSLTSLSLMQLLPNTLKTKGAISFTKNNGTVFNLQTATEKELVKFRGQEASMIFQDPMSSLNPSQKTGKQMMEAVQLHQRIKKNEIREKVLQSFEQVHLPNPQRIFDSYPFQLSGGQRQRVMIAMALINNPQLLIADEATTALDVTVQHEIIELLKSLQKQLNLTILFITHDLSLLHGFADYIMVMQNGKIVEQGTENQILTQPQKEYTKALIACRPAATKKQHKLPIIDDFNSGHKYTPQPREKRIISKDVLISGKNINVHYRLKRGDFFQALGDINFNTYKGETLGIVGESGCGKTTFSKTILQLIPYKGQILLDNEPLGYRNKKDELKFRKKVQFVFQDPYSSLNPKIKIGDAIKEVLKVHRIKNKIKKTKELLEQVGLGEEFATRYPHELSGGQRQRVAIARALATEPDVLILDEAVAALDVSVQAKVLNLLNELKNKMGLTYIFISHDLEVVHYMADRIMVMKDGKIEEINQADILFNKPSSPYTKKLIATIPKSHIQG